MYIVVIVIGAFILLGTAFAGGNNFVYNKVKVKNRSAIGFTNSGTAVYNYQEINEYSDELSEQEKGNIQLNGELESVREVYNYINVRKGISGAAGDVTLGRITINSKKKVRVIENVITVNGGISRRGKKISIGGVQIKNTKVGRVTSNITIKGDIHAK